MKVVIDSNSLIYLARYYLPFDKKGVLLNFFKRKIQDGDIIIIDKVLEECKYTSKGIVLETIEYLKDKDFIKSARIPFKTDSLIAPSPAKFIRQVENQFVQIVVKNQRKISDAEFENQKDTFLNSTDIKLIILCLNLINDGETVFLVTEETEYNNDNKLFLKIPAICKILNIQKLNLPELLSKLDDIDIDFQ